MDNSASTDRQVFRSLPLARKLPLLILGVLAFVLTLSLAISYYAVRHAAIVTASERMASLSQVLASLLQQQAANRLATMYRVADDTAIRNAAASPDRPLALSAIVALQPLLTRADSLTPPELWTPEGRAVGNIRLDIAPEVEAVREEIRAGALASDTGFISKLYPRNGYASYWEAVPIHHAGRTVGLLVQERRMLANQRALQPLRSLIGPEIDFLYRNAGDATWREVGGKAIAAPDDARLLNDSVQIIRLDQRGDLLAASARVRGTPFAITAVQPMSVILARPRATIRGLAIIALLLSLLGGGIAWGFSRQITRPLVELTRAAEAIAQGEYSQRVNANGTDEVGRLGIAFNRMAEQVQQSSERSAEALAQLTQSVATQQFLADASRILATSLSDQMLLSELTRFCVPTIADYCSLHLIDDDGSLRRVESAHYDPAKQDALRDLVSRYTYRVDDPSDVPTVIRTQQPLVVPSLDPDVLKAKAPDAEAARLLEEIGPRSFMCVPLIARGQALGAISFTMTDSGRTLGPSDLDLAMELARRTAVAIDNALIYKRSLALRMEAEAASSAKSDFLAKMSHEIRTPINAMMGYAELLEMGISGPVLPAQAKQLARIRASGEHLTSLVNEILDLAKIEAGRMGVEPTIGIAADAVEGALALVRPQAVTKGIELHGRSESDPRVEYSGDPQRVQQILANLLSNAVKFTPPGGHVSVRCAVAKRPDAPEKDRDREWACVTVEDTGVGIAPTDLDRVFDAFVQVDAGYTRAQGGTGLGLTISRGLAQMMGGDITVESTLGQGSRFTLWLPVARFVQT